MLLQNFIIYGLLFLLFGFIFADNSNAQMPVCNLQIDVYELSSEQPLKPVENLKAVLTNLTAEKPIEQFVSNKVTLFKNLTSGKYKIEVIKYGFERRVKELELNCKTVDEILTVLKPLYLQKGDVKKLSKFDSLTYGASHNNGQSGGKFDEAAINDSAIILTKPKYPSAAQAVRATGAVQVKVTIDEDGEIAAADAISGHPLLQRAAEVAAKDSRFSPTLLGGKPVKITGIIVYNFIS